MFQTQEIAQNFHFYHKLSTQFKDNTLVFRFLLPMSQESINTALVWSQLCDDRTTFAPTKQQMLRVMDELYDASYGSYLTTYGQSFALTVVFKGIEGSFVNDETQNDAFVTWALNVLTHVLMTEETLKEAKLNVFQNMKREQENSVKHALALSAERFLPQSYGLKVEGDESVMNLTLDELIKFQSMLFQQPTACFQVGQLDQEMVMNHLKKSILNQDKSSLLTYTLLNPLPLDRQSVFKVSSQSVLIKTYATNIDYADERYLALRVGAIALGSLPTSLLFTTVREKHSLCYFITANVIAFDGVLNIITGIDKENVDQVSLLIDEQWKAFKEVSDELISQAKLMMLNSLRSSDDDVMSTVNLMYASSLKNEVFDLSRVESLILNLSKEDIINAMNQCVACNEFVLLGENHV